MWTKKGAAVLGGGVIALLLALLFLNRALLLVGLMMLMLVACSRVSGASFERLAPQPSRSEGALEEPKGIAADRRVSARRVFEDALVKISVDIDVRRSQGGSIEVYDELPPEVELVEGSNHGVYKGRGKWTLEYTARFPLMGPYSLGPLRVRTEDPLGFAFNETELQSVDDVLVMPRIETVGEMFFRSKVPKMYSGAMTIKKPGPGYDFFSLREYVHGDAMRDINWKASARSRKLMVNEREREAISNVMIILDATASTVAGPRGSSALVRGARAAASLASYYLNRRDSVGLVVYDSSIRMIAPATGQGQLMKILEALSILEPKGDLPLDAVAKVGLAHLPSRSPVMVVSPLAGDTSVGHAVSTMAAHGFNVTVLSLSVAEMEAKHGFLDAPSLSVERLRREGVVRDLAGMGARMVDWHPDEGLNVALMGV